MLGDDDCSFDEVVYKDTCSRRTRRQSLKRVKRSRPIQLRTDGRTLADLWRRMPLFGTEAPVANQGESRRRSVTESFMLDNASCSQLVQGRIVGWLAPSSCSPVVSL